MVMLLTIKLEFSFKLMTDVWQNCTTTADFVPVEIVSPAFTAAPNAHGASFNKTSPLTKVIRPTSSVTCKR